LPRERKSIRSLSLSRAESTQQVQGYEALLEDMRAIVFGAGGSIHDRPRRGSPHDGTEPERGQGRLPARNRQCRQPADPGDNGRAGRQDERNHQKIARMASLNLLKRPMSVTDTAKAAAFLVSDRARMMTATVVNSTAGAAAD
jgi:hypothetical protein